MRTGAVASTSGRPFSSPSSSKTKLPASNSLAPLPSLPLQRRQRSRAGRPNGIVVAQAGQLPPAPVRGGGGRGSREVASSSTTAAQPSTSTLTTAPLTSSSSSSPTSLATSAAAGALLAAAAAWAVSSFARERGAVSSSASAAGLRGEASAGRGRSRRGGGSRGRGSSSFWGRRKPASDDSDLSSTGPPPRSYRAALSVTRRSVALTRAVQAADFGNIAAALTELDRALAEHAAAGGSWEERTTSGGEEGEAGGEEQDRRRQKASLLPSGVGEEDMRRLYVLHLQNSEDLFSSPEELGPLRSLLRLSEEEAKEVEDDVMTATGGFSI